MAVESVSLSQCLSPHQTFTPINKLRESPYVSVSLLLNRSCVFIESKRKTSKRIKQVPSKARARFKLGRSELVLQALRAARASN